MPTAADHNHLRLFGQLDKRRNGCGEAYFCDHHQPFGDFKSHLNRLPELLFLQVGGDRKQVLDALDAGRFDEAREMVLTPVVRKKIY